VTSHEEALLQLKADVREVMSTKAGRRLMHHVLEVVCATFAESYTGEAFSSAYAQGRRAAGLRLQALLQQYAPAEFVLLLGEELQTRGNP